MTAYPSRRTFVAGAFALSVGTARADALEKVRVSIIPISDVTPLFVGIKRGFFREQGLEIDTASSTGGAVGIPGLISGSFNIAYGNVVSCLLAAQQGIDVKVVAPGTQTVSAETDTSELLVRADDAIHSGKDLEGRSVGVNTRNNVIWLYARAWIRMTGGNPDKVVFREVAFPSMEDALRQKQVDAAFMVAPYTTVALGKPEFRALAKPYSSVQPGVDVGQYLATGDYYRAKTQTVEKFARGLRQGAEWYNANLGSEETLELMAGFTRIDLGLLRQVKLSPVPLQTDLGQMKKTMQLMTENKLLRAPLDITAVVAPTAL